MSGTTQSYEEVDTYYQRALDGHVFIRDTIEALLDSVEAYVTGFMRTSRQTPRILELGSHAGFITERLIRRCPKARFEVWETDASLVKMSRHRIGGHEVIYHTCPLELVPSGVDVVVSVARHHHLPHEYLRSLVPLMAPDARYILADEFCPEYCSGAQRDRMQTASVMHVAGGYVFTSQSELETYERAGLVPGPVLELELLRKRALWRWYRFVVDEAIARGYFDIAVGELQSTHDDLITGSPAEHKFSPLVVERQLALAGLHTLVQRPIGPPEQADLQSMFVFECERSVQLSS